MPPEFLPDRSVGPEAWARPDKYRDALGVLRRESSGVEKEHEARRLLKQREGAAVEGRVIAPRVEKITIAQLAEDLRTDYRANRRKSLDRIEDAFGHLLPFFGPLRAVQVSSADVSRYKAQRQEQRAANATVNRELAALKRMFPLALKAESIHHAPYVDMLKENNRRAQFRARRRAAQRGHEDGWSQDRERLPALRDRRRGDAARRGGQAHACRAHWAKFWAKRGPDCADGDR